MEYEQKTISKKREGTDSGLPEAPAGYGHGSRIVTAVGNDQVMVENYRGILEYTPNSIVLQSKTCRIAFCGCGLRIAYYTNEDMKIEGKISEIRYL